MTLKGHYALLWVNVAFLLWYVVQGRGSAKVYRKFSIGPTLWASAMIAIVGLGDDEFL